MWSHQKTRGKANEATVSDKTVILNKIKMMESFINTAFNLAYDREESRKPDPRLLKEKYYVVIDGKSLYLIKMGQFQFFL